jgi:hypothetical protein
MTRTFLFPTGDVKTIATALGKPIGSGIGWYDCRCPCHDDRKSSLSLHITPKGYLIAHCQAGCSREALDPVLLNRGLLSPLRSNYSPPIAVAAGEDQDAKMAGLARLLSSNIDNVRFTPSETALTRLLGRPIPTMPPDLRHKSFARKDDSGKWTIHAIIALCRNSEGEVSAALLRYINQDGTDAILPDDKATKQTRGVIKGAAFHLPGKSPTILCEGLTTALSLWLATGHECLAYGGVKNLIDVPLLDGKGVIVFADNDDGKGTPEQLHDREQTHLDAIDAFVLEGRTVAYVRPNMAGWDGRDVLTNQGPDELRRLVYEDARLFREPIPLDYELNEPA